MANTHIDRIHPPILLHLLHKIIWPIIYLQCTTTSGARCMPLCCHLVCTCVWIRVKFKWFSLRDKSGLEIRRKGLQSNQFQSSSTGLVICKAGASSACLWVTKLMPIALYCKLKQFTNIILYIFT